MANITCLNASFSSFLSIPFIADKIASLRPPNVSFADFISFCQPVKPVEGSTAFISLTNVFIPSDIFVPRFEKSNSLTKLYQLLTATLTRFATVFPSELKTVLPFLSSALRNPFRAFATPSPHLLAVERAFFQLIF